MSYADEYLDVRGPDDIRIKGTRVGIEHLLTAYMAGSLPEEISLEFPTVTLEQVHGVIAWYLRNRAEADAYLRRWEAQARQVRRQQARGDQPEVLRRLRESGSQRVAQ
ncbi:MAG: DUF433 domain-containing protein [Thermoguttaceae bacterium]|jgi:uncharacterized protein (DUF433 family)